MPTLSKKTNVIRKSPIRKVAALLDYAKDRKTIISFGGGSPSLPPPPEIVNEIVNQFKQNPQRISAYTGTRGVPELREAIGKDVKKYTGCDVDPETQVLITDGATEGILTALLSTVNSGDEVIVTDPTYLGYSEAVKVAGGRVVRLPVTVDEGFQPDIEKLKKIITKRTKAILLLSPDNPTGRIIEKERAEAIVDLAVDHDFWVICDDAYCHIVYEGEHVWVYSLKGAEDRTIVCNSFSKTASIPGLRLGFAYGPAQAIDGMEKFKQYMTLCPDTVGQYAMIKFLSGDIKEKYLRDVVIPTYKERRDAMGKYLTEYLPEAKTVRPGGAFYYFVDMSAYLKKLGMNENELVEDLVKERDVIIVPGSHFGENCKLHVRVTFVSESTERIREGVKRIQEYLVKKGVAKT
jgi:aspartate aminotransferase